MRFRVLALSFVVLTVLGIPLRSETETPSPNPLEQFAWMLGGKWTADDKAPDGKPFHVESRFSWGENGHALKFTTWFLIDGKLVPVYTGLYAWHPAKKKFTFLYTDNKGALTEGEAIWSGDHLDQEFQIVDADGTSHTLRSTIVRMGQDEYGWNVQHQDKTGAWVVIFGLKYQRKPA